MLHDAYDKASRRQTSAGMEARGSEKCKRLGRRTKGVAVDEGTALRVRQDCAHSSSSTRAAEGGKDGGWVAGRSDHVWARRVPCSQGGLAGWVWTGAGRDIEAKLREQVKGGRG